MTHFSFLFVESSSAAVPVVCSALRTSHALHIVEAPVEAVLIDFVLQP